MSDVFYWQGISPYLHSPGVYPGRNPRVERDHKRGLVCEYDVPVKMRDGATIYVNVYRPDTTEKVPALLAWGPYGKHVPFNESRFPGSGVRPDDLSEYCPFEGPDPLYWCPNGYAVVVVDPRGAWGSEGVLTFFSEQEATDCYDTIEWISGQPWCNGKLGMTGVSYLSSIQYYVAALHPPHLAAINPWEGATDLYREVAFHGGIPSDFFKRVARTSWGFSLSGKVEDLARMVDEHPLLDEYWKRKQVDLRKIMVPAFIVANWGDHGLHTRGSIEAFVQISSTRKYLLIHGRRKWQFYREMVDLQRKFFDRFLKDMPNEVDNWPPVRLEVREKYLLGSFRTESEWPLSRTVYTKLYLHPNSVLAPSPLANECSLSYEAKSERLQFEYFFEKDTEITGHMMLKLWVDTDEGDDMDLFVAIEKYDMDGEYVRFPHNVYPYDRGPVALGWLRVSHRELDEERSSFFRPVYKHEKLSKKVPGEIVPVEIEIWPSSTLFRRGERLRLIVQGRDILGYRGFSHTQTVNRGKHIVWIGGKYDSYLLIPVIP